MIRITVSELVKRPIEEVWTVVTNFDNWAKAAGSGSVFRQTSAGPLGVGAIVEARRTILGRSRQTHSMTITDFEPNRVFGMTDKVPGLRRLPQRFAFEATPGGTRVTRSVELVLGRGRLLEPVVAPLLRRIWRYEGAAMKRIIEAGA
jgi:hypothetical protein